LAKELVAERMAQRVVDILEVVEVEAQHGECPVAAQMGQTSFDLLPEEKSIWQIRQCVVERHMGDLGFGLSTLGDVFMRDHPAAAAHMLVRDQHFTTIRRLDDQIYGLPLRNLAQKQGAILVRVASQ